MKKGLRLLSALSLVALLSLVAFVSQTRGDEGEHFSVKEYGKFHDVLHPLQHDAFPKGDFKMIRARACELLVRGDDIVKLGVPTGVKAEKRGEFETEMRKFSEALAKFKADAASGTDEQLKASYPPVHDTFEMLASMLPRKEKMKAKGEKH